MSQHTRDEELMRSLTEYLNCGRYLPRNNKDFGEFIVTKFEDLTDKIIPFFKKYSIIGVKALDFADFSLVAELMKNKVHLTKNGLNQISKIKEGMNKRRKIL